MVGMVLGVTGPNAQKVAEQGNSTGSVNVIIPYHRLVEKIAPVLVKMNNFGTAHLEDALVSKQSKEPNLT